MKCSKVPRQRFQKKRSLVPRPRIVLRSVQFWRSVVVDPTRSVRDIDLNFVSVSSFWQLIVKGAVLRVAVMAHERNAVFES